MALPSTKIGPSAGMQFISSPHIRESKTVIDSGFHAVDSGFQVLDSSFFFQLNLAVRIPIVRGMLHVP